jgi:gluconate kinase
MDPELLDSQFAALEIPDDGIHVEVSQSPDQILREILEKI